MVFRLFLFFFCLDLGWFIDVYRCSSILDGLVSDLGWFV